MRKENDRFKPSGLRIASTALPETNSSFRPNRIDWKAEQFLKVIQQDALEIIFVVNLQGNVRYANDAVKKMLGYDPSELKEKSIQKIIPVRQWVAFRAALRASEEEAEESIKIDCQLLTNKGKKVHFELAVKDQRHHPLVEGYVVHAKNIDRLKKQDEQLRLRNLAIEIVQEAIIIVTVKGPSIEYANQAFYELSGFTRQDIIGEKINVFKQPYSEMLFSDPTPPLTIKKFQNAISNNRIFKDRIYSKRKNGQTFYNRIMIKPVLNVEGQTIKYVVSMKEITKRNNG